MSLQFSNGVQKALFNASVGDKTLINLFQILRHLLSTKECHKTGVCFSSDCGDMVGSGTGTDSLGNILFLRSLS